MDYGEIRRCEEVLQAPDTGEIIEEYTEDQPSGLLTSASLPLSAPTP